MGALHEGHLSLVRASKAQCDCTVVSIYVNPSQFGPQEDLAKYPRTLQADLDALAALDAELVFAPGNEEMYPEGLLHLGGGGRSGRTAGRAMPAAAISAAWPRSCSSCSNIVQPDAAYFGQKDYQQALVIRRMVRDLNVPVEIAFVPSCASRMDLP